MPQARAIKGGSCCSVAVRTVTFGVMDTVKILHGTLSVAQYARTRKDSRDAMRRQLLQPCGCFNSGCAAG